MNKTTFYITKYLCFIFLLCLSLPTKAQEKKIVLNTTNKATLIGIGTSNLYDTYLSPLKYTGTSIRLIHERANKTSWFHNNFIKQQIYSIEFDKADNPAKNSTEYAFILNIKLGGHHNLIKTDKFKFALGGLWDLVTGILYNERNSNNPASGKAYTNVNLSALTLYNWKNFTFKGQIDTPILGMAFSPHYRQSYYEISLRKSLDVLNFVSLHNQRAINAYFTVDVPLNRISLRIGYLSTLYQSKIHNIQTHSYTNNLMVGLVSESINFGGKILKENKLIKSVYY